jgi:hypothetical protein
MRAEETRITAADLGRIRHERLRTAAAEALARGEDVRLIAGTGDGGGRVETLVFTSSRRAAQSSGSVVFWGEWTGERLVTDRGGHRLAADGTCFCRDCETAGGYTLDDDE